MMTAAWVSWKGVQSSKMTALSDSLRKCCSLSVGWPSPALSPPLTLDRRLAVSIPTSLSTLDIPIGDLLALQVADAPLHDRALWAGLIDALDGGTACGVRAVRHSSKFDHPPHESIVDIPVEVATQGDHPAQQLLPH